MEKETTNENFLKIKNIKLHKYLYMTQWTIIIFKYKNCKTTKKNIKLYGRHNPIYMKPSYRVTNTFMDIGIKLALIQQNKISK
jgi:hypothetical protein